MLTRHTSDHRRTREIDDKYQPKSRTFSSMPAVKQLRDGQIVEVLEDGNYYLVIRDGNTLRRTAALTEV
jgi:hypothetical protein